MVLLEMTFHTLKYLEHWINITTMQDLIYPIHNLQFCCIIGNSNFSFETLNFWKTNNRLKTSGLDRCRITYEVDFVVFNVCTTDFRSVLCHNAAWSIDVPNWTWLLYVPALVLVRTTWTCSFWSTLFFALL